MQLFKLIRATAPLLILATFFTAGCGSEPAAPTNPTIYSPLPWLKTGTATYGHFYITSQRAGNNTPSYHSGGLIYASTNNTQSVNGGTMTAGGTNINFDSDHLYYSIAQPTFGAVSTWGLTGNPTLSIPSFTDAMYVPQEISMNSPTIPSNLSKSSPLNVLWNSDPNNDSIVILFNYDVPTSQFVDSTKPNVEYGKFYIVPDNGTFTIPTNDLSPIPTNGYIMLLIGRGKGKLTGTSTHKFYIYGSSIAHGTFKVTP